MTRIRLGTLTLVLLALAAAAVLGLAATSSGSTASTAAAKRVAVKDNRFSPKAVSVSKGGKVTWVWKGSNDHNVTFTKAPKGASKHGSSTKSSGRFTRSFNKRGTYRYVCTIHAGMKGSVTAG